MNYPILYFKYFNVIQLSSYDTTELSKYNRFWDNYEQTKKTIHYDELSLNSMVENLNNIL